MNSPRNALVAPVWVLLLAGVADLSAAPIGSPGGGWSDDNPFFSSDSLRLREGQTAVGDRYFLGRIIDISGVQDGDLLGMAQTGVIRGEVRGDLAYCGQSLEITDGAIVHDTLRFFGDTLTIKGTVDGDVVAAGGSVTVSPGGRITGSMHLFAGVVDLSGTTDGHLKFTGGKLILAGSIAGDADVTADQITIVPGTSIGGDLTYGAREELSPADLRVVGGLVEFEPKTEEEDEQESRFTLNKFMWWSWFTLSAMLVGFVTLGLFRRAAPALTSPIDSEGMLVALIGLGIFLVVPAASALAIVLIVSIPLGVIGLLVFVIALYLAKLPVAIWIGERLLSIAGREGVSPFVALAIGTILLYALFEIPYLGFFIYLVAIWLGLGSMIVAARTYFREGDRTSG